MLLDRLPEDALLNTTAEQRAEPWPTQSELLAQLVELLSVSASEMRLRKPFKLPRPEWVRGGSRRVAGRRTGAPLPAGAPEEMRHALGVLMSTRDARRAGR